jgi:hypothetical protein
MMKVIATKSNDMDNILGGSPKIISIIQGRGNSKPHSIQARPLHQNKLEVDMLFSSIQKQKTTHECVSGSRFVQKLL